MPATQTFRSRTRRRAGPAAALAGIALCAAACSAGAGSSGGPSGSDPQLAVSSGDAGSARSGDTPPADGQRRSTGSFTAGFARCMRAHGVPRFPDPNGTPGQLGPDSGVDLASAQFQAAVNGPCRSLAPPAWVSTGPDTIPGGGG
jgi:hypothetical protein